ncbi:hypothetical protein KEM52_000820 [Ascosphaera acerosa]|nr:hypothetical protein KEM52_000820 [Ascosphaera acerosa]
MWRPGRGMATATTTTATTATALTDLVVAPDVPPPPAACRGAASRARRARAGTPGRGSRSWRCGRRSRWRGAAVAASKQAPPNVSASKQTQTEPADDQPSAATVATSARALGAAAPTGKKSSESQRRAAPPQQSGSGPAEAAARSTKDQEATTTSTADEPDPDPALTLRPEAEPQAPKRGSTSPQQSPLRGRKRHKKGKGKEKSKSKSGSSRDRSKSHSQVPSATGAEESAVDADTAPPVRDSTEAPAASQPRPGSEAGPSGPHRDPSPTPGAASPDHDSPSQGAPADAAPKAPGLKKEKEKRKISDTIREQLPPRPFETAASGEDTISVSRARPGADAPSAEAGKHGSGDAPTRNVSLRAARWESLLRREGESTPPPPKGSSKSSHKKRGKAKGSGQSGANAEHGSRAEGPAATETKVKAADGTAATGEAATGDAQEPTAEKVSKHNQQQPPRPPHRSPAAHASQPSGEVLAEVATNLVASGEDVPLQHEAAAAAAAAVAAGVAPGPGPGSDVDVADVLVEDDEGESLHMSMGERLKIRKNRVASGLDKVIKGIQKRALSAARAQKTLLGQDKKAGNHGRNGTDGQGQPAAAAAAAAEAWLTDGRRTGYGYQFVEQEQHAAARTVPATHVTPPSAADEASVDRQDSDKENENSSHAFETADPTHAPTDDPSSHDWHGRSGGVDTSTLDISSDADQADDRKAEKDKRWFSLGHGAIRKLVSEKMGDVLRASPSSVQRAFSNTSLAASIFSEQQQLPPTTAVAVGQEDLPPPSRSVRSLTGSTRTVKSNRSSPSLVSIVEQVEPEHTSDEEALSPPPRLSPPPEQQHLTANSVYSFGEDLQRQLSSINLSDIETASATAVDATPRPRATTAAVLNPIETTVEPVGPRTRTPLGAGLNVNVMVGTQGPGAAASGGGGSGMPANHRSEGTGSSMQHYAAGMRSRSGTGSSMADSRRGRAGYGNAQNPHYPMPPHEDGRDSLRPPALRPRARRSSSPKPPAYHMQAHYIASHEESEVRHSTAAFSEKLVSEAQRVKDQLTKLVDDTWQDEP